MIRIGNFFFKYRNMVFPVFALIFFIPSPALFTENAFGENYYLIPMIPGLIIALGGQAVRGATIGLKYILRGGKNKKVYARDLVTDGIFHHCRNPLYVGNIMMLSGVALLSNSWIALITVPLFCFIYQAIVMAEEHFLREKFGNGFVQYCQDVNRWWPSLKGLRQTFGSMRFNWKRYIVNEYNTIYLLLLSIYIILLMHHPYLENLEGDEKIRISLIVFGSLSLIYLLVRYLRKTERLNPSAY